MRATLDIAARDLRSRLRDRSALVTAFVAPLALAVILSTALGGSGGVSVTIAVADEDGGDIGAAIGEALAGSEVITPLEVVDAAAVQAAIDEGSAGAGLIVPAGTLEALGAGAPASLQVRRRAGALSGDLAVALANGVAARFERGRQATALALGAGADAATAAALAEEALTAEPALAVVEDQVGGSLPDAASYFGPAMAVFFVFFVVGAGPQSLLRLREQGTMARLAAAPIRRTSILVGTALSVLVLALASIVTLWLVMSVAFGASWGNPVGVLALALGITVAAAAITMLIATLARTEEQVTGWTSIVVFTLALLGGSFGTLPPSLEPLQLATPNGLALRGFVDLAAGGSLGVVVVPLLGTVAFTAVALALALPRADRLVAP